MQKNKLILYAFVSLFTFAVVLISINYELSTFGLILTAILGLFLTQWYLFVGLIKPRDAEIQFFKEKNGRLLPIWQVFTGSSIVAVYVIVLGFITDKNFDWNGAGIILLYVIGPALLLLHNKWYTFALSAIWVWFPIEWDLISDAIHISLGLPFPALLGLFSLLWPAIMYGRHLPWFDWDLTKDDLKYANYGILGATLAIVPLGYVLYFLKPNLNEFAGLDVAGAVSLVLLTFLGIFFVQGIMEETLFRDIIMKHWYEFIQGKERVYSIGSILFTGLLIISIPFWGSTLRFIAHIFPVFTGVADRVGDLHAELGTHNGVAIPAFVGMPLWPFYLAVGVLLTIFGLLLYLKLNDPLVAALVASAMVFGFAHFEDWRYVMFAAFAGIAYGYTFYKTKNIAASALVHMGVDAVWSLVLTY